MERSEVKNPVERRPGVRIAVPGILRNAQDDLRFLK